MFQHKRNSYFLITNVSVVSLVHQKLILQSMFWSVTRFNWAHVDIFTRKAIQIYKIWVFINLHNVALILYLQAKHLTSLVDVERVTMADRTTKRKKRDDKVTMAPQAAITKVQKNVTHWLKRNLVTTIIPFCPTTSINWSLLLTLFDPSFKILKTEFFYCCRGSFDNMCFWNSCIEHFSFQLPTIF